MVLNFLQLKYFTIRKKLIRCYNITIIFVKKKKLFQEGYCLALRHKIEKTVCTEKVELQKKESVFHPLVFSNLRTKDL